MKLAVAYHDAERAVVDWLTEQLPAHGEDATVGVGVPVGWERGDTEHVQVDFDGTPLTEHPVIAHATVRLVAWASSTTDAKRLVSVATGLLLAHPGGDGIAATRPQTGVLPVHDDEHNAELASTTTRVTVRSYEIEPSGS